MLYLLRTLRIAAVLFLANLAIAPGLLPIGGAVVPVLTVVCFAVFVAVNLYPRRAHAPTRRLRVLLGGYEILLTAAAVAVLSLIAYPLLWWTGQLEKAFPGMEQWAPLLLNLLFFLPVVGVLLINGFFRVLLTCKRLRLVWRVLLLTLWWVPVFQLYLFYRALKSARSEYFFECARLEREERHAENEDCKTRYPIVLVHGIFFRDWQHINYWGRIPRALQACGATIYYGGQQSAAPVRRSAEELRARIEQVLDETGADKVNLIAHSKGGLDSRYAIAKLGLADRVVSLTTVNTPHRGCVFAEHLLHSLPAGVLRQMERRYNGLFRHLGDNDPDFMGGVRDLTASACAAFNQTVADAPGVCYQSTMSVMRRGASAGFPLNLTWRLVRKYDKEENDGLVARSSAAWGAFLGEKTGAGKRGVSHGDVVDLMREDIAGFDVREQYIAIVRDLKAKGL